MSETETSENEFEAFKHILLDEDETLEQLRHKACDITDVNVQFDLCHIPECSGDHVTVMFYTDEFDNASEYIQTCYGCCDFECHALRFRSGERGTVKLD